MSVVHGILFQRYIITYQQNTIDRKTWAIWIKLMLKPRQFHWAIGSIIRDQWENSLAAIYLHDESSTYILVYSLLEFA